MTNKPPTPSALTKVTFRLPESLVKRAKHWAVDADKTLQDVVQLALDQFLARKDRHL